MVSEVVTGGWISDLTIAAVAPTANPMVGDSFTRAPYAMTTFTDGSGSQIKSSAYVAGVDRNTIGVYHLAAEGGFLLDSPTTTGQPFQLLTPSDTGLSQLVRPHSIAISPDGEIIHGRGVV